MISPLLTNVYLHYVFDLWGSRIFARSTGRASAWWFGAGRCASGCERSWRKSKASYGTIPGVGVVLELSWALELGEPSRSAADRSPSNATNICRACWWRRPSWLRVTTRSCAGCTNASDAGGGPQAGGLFVGGRPSAGWLRGAGRDRLEDARENGAIFTQGLTTGKGSLPRLRPPVAARVSDGRLRRESERAAACNKEKKNKEKKKSLRIVTTSCPPVLACLGTARRSRTLPRRPFSLFRGRRVRTQTESSAKAARRAARGGTWMSGPRGPTTDSLRPAAATFWHRPQPLPPRGSGVTAPTP